MEKITYDYKFLQNYTNENQITLLKDYSNEMIIGKTRIEGYCKEKECTKTFNKPFTQLFKTGGYCDECIKKISNIKMRMTLSNKVREKLMEYCNNNNVELLKNYSDEFLNIKFTDIEGKCIGLNCHNTFIKKIVNLFKSGAFCLECTQNNKQNKMKNTCLKKYGVDNATQSDVVKEKIKKTCIEKYGVESATKTNIVKEKMKKTCLERYGVDNATKTNIVKEKIKKTCLERYGETSYFKTNEFKKRYEKICLEKYGVTHSLKSKIVRQKIINTNILKYGSYCVSKNKLVQNKIKITNLKKYGFTSAMKNKLVQNKTKITNLKKYGKLYTLQNKEIKNKAINTTLEKYGVDNYSKTDEYKIKIKSTNLKKYGKKSYNQTTECKEKIKSTNLKKYGKHYSQTEEYKQKCKETSLKNYGVEYPFQNPEFAEKMYKNSFKLKEYTLPSGKIIKYQGYEHFAYNELLNIQKLDENELITSRKEVPEVWYEDGNGKRHRYYVDIFIPSQKKCIEVKSTWTMRNPEFVFEKQRAVKELGYECEIWVYDKDGTLIEKHI